MSTLAIVSVIAVVGLIIAAFAVRPRRNEEGQRKRPLLSFAFVAAAVAVVLLVTWPAIAGITINWASWSMTIGALGFALVFAGFATGRSFFAAIGLVLLAVFAALALGVTWWVLVPAGLAAVFITVDHLTRRTIFALLAVVALAASVFVGIKVDPPSADDLVGDLLTQVHENDQTFADWNTLCAEAAKTPGSAQDLTCKKVNGIQDQVDANTKDIKTLSGRVAKVTERVDKGGITVKSSSGSDKSTDKAIKAIGKDLKRAGWKKGDVLINRVDDKIHKEHAGDYNFGKRLRTKEELVKYLNGKSKEAKANRELILKDVPKDQHDRLLSGEGWYSLQFLRASCLDGNGMYVNGRAEINKNVVCHNAGDIVWVYTGPNGKVYWGTAVRDDCRNGHLNGAPAPVKGSHPVQPSRTTRQTNVYTPPTTHHNPPKQTTPPSGGCKSSDSCKPPKGKPKCKPNQTGTYPHCKDKKVGSNRGIDTKGEKHTVSREDGSKVSNGLQKDPVGDAKKAADEAKKVNDKKTDDAKKAADEATTDSGGGDKSHGSTGDGGSKDDKGDQSGDIWDK